MNVHSDSRLSNVVETELSTEDELLVERLVDGELSEEEREKIVAKSIGNIDGACDGCAAGLADMYRDYIDGKKEIRDINREFVARYVSGAEGPSKTGCGYT